MKKFNDGEKALKVSIVMKFFHLIPTPKFQYYYYYYFLPDVPFFVRQGCHLAFKKAKSVKFGIF
jgi:hypothetical protein